MKSSLAILSLFASSLCLGQHEHASETVAKKSEHIAIFDQAFTDSSFVGKEIKVALFTVPAGAIDLTKHVHDCQLIGYILEGEVITKLKDKVPQHLKKGDVFYEFPNEVHESLQNPNEKMEAKILLYYLFNAGAVLYKKVEN